MGLIPIPTYILGIILIFVVIIVVGVAAVYMFALMHQSDGATATEEDLKQEVKDLKQELDQTRSGDES